MDDVKRVRILLEQLEDAAQEMLVAAETESIRDLISNENEFNSPEMDVARFKFDGITGQLDQLYTKLN